MGTMTQPATERVILMRNTPMSAREWQELTNVPGVTSISADAGDLALIRQQGELALYWQFEDLDAMRQHFQPMFEEMRPEIADADVDFVTMDLVQVRDRDWLKPLLDDASFTFFAEWMDMTHPGLDPDAIPEFPEGLLGFRRLEVSLRELEVGLCVVGIDLERVLVLNDRLLPLLALVIHPGAREVIVELGLVRLTAYGQATEDHENDCHQKLLHRVAS
jgi:hypothetical protein